jgi:hypothetical protein
MSSVDTRSHTYKQHLDINIFRNHTNVFEPRKTSLRRKNGPGSEPGVLRFAAEAQVEHAPC